tara:strand:+ start:337 stop:462 length:126 start_codon:yes stop_codon:yes gene_type:complete
MSRYKIYKHLTKTDAFGIATKIKQFRKPKNKNNKRTVTTAL